MKKTTCTPYNDQVVSRQDQNIPSDRPTLTPRMVVEAALGLAETAGIEAVTIRKLARELNVTPMALYWHFRSKHELLDGMVDRIYEKIDPDLTACATWQEELRALLGSIVNVLRTHPATAALLASRSTTSESSLRTTELALDILRRAGFSPTEATQVTRHALSVVTDLVNGADRTAYEEDPAELTDERRRMRIFLESLPPARYPRLVEASVPLSECDNPDAYFTFGLDLLLAGIETTATRNYGHA